MSEAIEGDRTFVDKFPEEARIVRAALLSSFFALTLGAIFGIIQTLHRTDVFRGIISSTDYYTSLTAHGVFLALSFTTFFLVGLFTWAVVRSLDRPLINTKITWTWYGLMAVGMTMTGISILAGFVDSIDMSADVLFTFYAPLQAHPMFYAGLAVFIVGSWIAGADFFRTWLAWKRENPDERIPLQTFMVLTTMAMWYIASSAVAASVLIFLLPWSLGLIDQVNPTLTRTLFWFFGHPVVYFWLMPAYLLWYTVLPKIAGGRLFSDPLARVVFVLFLLLSTPVGIHHQYLDPGIAEGFKFISMTNTMFLLLPSLLTAFTVVASVEYGARQRGGTGLLGWLTDLPWRKPEFTGMMLAGLMFAAGGFSGMVNAGMNINYMIHNTIWVPGHFHLTVGTAVALTFMAATYWIWPQITNKPIYSRSIGLFQVVLWFIGMALMSNAMHAQGILGAPRRTAEPEYSGFDYPTMFGGFEELNIQIAIGGTLLFVSTVLFIGNLVLTMGNPKVSGLAESLPPALSGPDDAPQVLDNLRLWFGIALTLVVLAYALPLAAIINRGGLLGPGVGTYPVWLVPALDALANAVTPLLGAIGDASTSLVEVVR
ncbi:b(o/a)3-type cytochrome-c oxidase subunit 1 [Halorubrum lacusprofundi]|jgi:cytochrome c oxidase subunit 1|uniref:Cytochrome c oxidase subunit I n=1 Tax=Halorubrum lacusprofundi (strain ATCC 49239 / DSM 5036 / JCM 8891 / ACAM 34) TaxID=416348 RepID=B9LSP1_HALLT|nr:b(o/a)3-type cytochrome-c oxidase subunit 1 [Halorubrum lacusprofundi]ACM57988.1 cytochrome c oxidase subunit I [Halorubrum lacusprofundi ATCC 49239]MCG1007924.1 b(o/a)3-type cytochrome-c oxidase subunit 1 [Halorubrum lacusprofundi]